MTFHQFLFAFINEYRQLQSKKKFGLWPTLPYHISINFMSFDEFQRHISVNNNEDLDENKFLYDSEEDEKLMKCEICGDIDANNSNDNDTTQLIWINDYHNNDLCNLRAHLLCLATYFLDDDKALLPKTSNCPLCSSSLSWIELIKNRNNTNNRNSSIMNTLINNNQQTISTESTRSVKRNPTMELFEQTKLSLEMKRKFEEQKSSPIKQKKISENDVQSIFGYVSSDESGDSTDSIITISPIL